MPHSAALRRLGARPDSAGTQSDGSVPPGRVVLAFLWGAAGRWSRKAVVSTGGRKRLGRNVDGSSTRRNLRLTPAALHYRRICCSQGSRSMFKTLITSLPLRSPFWQILVRICMAKSAMANQHRTLARLLEMAGVKRYAHRCRDSIRLKSIAARRVPGRSRHIPENLDQGHGKALRSWLKSTSKNITFAV